MKQIILRLITGAPGVLDVVYGEVLDGQFEPRPFCDAPESLQSYISEDDLLGTRGFIRTANLTDLVGDAISLGFEIVFYPNFVVLTSSTYESKEKENA